MLTTWSCAVTPGSRLSRSRRGWPSGWSREGWLSMRPRPGSSPFLRGLIFSDLISAATPTASCLSNRALRPSRGSGNGLPGSSAHSAGPTPKQYWRRSSPSRGDGAPTTRRWCHPGCSVAWTPIVRHTLVKGGASPDDPTLADYWASRRQKVKPPLDPSVVRLLSRQDGRCSRCGENLLTPDQPPQSPEGWERWFLQVIKTAITADYLTVHGQPAAGNDTRTHRMHANCRRRQQTERRRAGGTVPGLCT